MNCNNCNCNQFELVLSKDEYSLYKCKNCKLLFTFPHPDEVVLKEYYSKIYFKHWFEYRDVKRKTNLWRVRLVDKYVGSQKINLLDFGSGLGYFLLTVKEKFPHWNLFAVEYSDYGINHAREKLGLNVLHYNEFGSIHEQFDIITLWHTIEHLKDPDSCIKFLKKILKPGGLIFIETPNANSLLTKLRGLKCLNLIEHLYHYTPETLQYLMLKKNFKILLNIPGNPGYTRKGIKVFIKKFLSNTGKFIYRMINKNFDDTILMVVKNI